MAQTGCCILYTINHEHLINACEFEVREEIAIDSASWLTKP